MRRPLVQHRHRQAVIAANLDQFRCAGVEPIRYRVRASNEPKSPTDVIIEREAGQYTALINQNWRPARLVQNRSRLAAYLYWFSQTSPEIKRITVDLCDGNLPSDARYRFSTISSQHTLLPDAFFFRDRGYEATDYFAADHAPAWNDRSDDIVWRGALNGLGLFSVDPQTADNPGVILRLRMALKCKDSDVDFKFAYNKDIDSCEVLRSAGLIGDYIPAHNWGSMKYAIDIDGTTNAWCNFMQRLKLGCCILKVDSPFGYYQWYYHKLVAWEHYVPIRADLSDLDDKIDWVRTNPDKARTIAEHSQAFAKAMTFDSETAVAVQAIQEREARA